MPYELLVIHTESVFQGSERFTCTLFCELSTLYSLVVE